MNRTLPNRNGGSLVTPILVKRNDELQTRYTVARQSSSLERCAAVVKAWSTHDQRFAVSAASRPVAVR